MKKVRYLLLSILLGAVSFGAPYKTNMKTAQQKVIHTVQKAPQKIRRLWACLTKPERYNCSESDIKKARIWFYYTPSAILSAALLGAGILIGTKGTQNHIKPIDTPQLFIIGKEGKVLWKHLEETPIIISKQSQDTLNTLKNHIYHLVHNIPYKGDVAEADFNSIKTKLAYLVQKTGYPLERLLGKKRLDDWNGLIEKLGKTKAINE